MYNGAQYFYDVYFYNERQKAFFHKSGKIMNDILCESDRRINMHKFFRKNKVK